MYRLHCKTANFVLFFFRNCLWVLLLFRLGARSKEVDIDIETKHIDAVVGQKVVIPCNITPAVFGDSNTLVLWYKDDSETPFYSLDNRTDGVNEEDIHPDHFVTDFVLNRAYFNMAPMIPRLEIQNIMESDSGLYRCRVDFVKSRTVNYQTRLRVIVPPEKPKIRNEDGKTLSGLIGPYNEDDALFLVCEVRRGKPRPSLKWWKGPELIHGQYSETAGGLIRNDLIMLRLTRNHYRMNLTCSASNNNITQPPSAEVTIDMNFKPLTVEITDGKKAMSTNKMNEVTCISTGSIPPARITWWKGTKKMTNIKYMIIDNGPKGVTAKSILMFKPTSKDDSSFLTCRAQNKDIIDSALEDGFKITVHYAPVVILKIQSNDDDDDIKEGNDVFFSCSVSAKPATDSIQWLLNGLPLRENVTEDIVISGDTLHLQNVKHAKNGLYSCRASNSFGNGVSNTIDLKVSYSPICAKNQTFIYGTSLHVDVHVYCNVNAYPPIVDFHWKFNNSVDEFEITNPTNNGLMSKIKYTPRKEDGYGKFFCWGSNRVGKQYDPCIFNLVYADVPGRVKDCIVLNRTYNSFNVECTPGPDGGLPQIFVMEVFDQITHTLLANTTSNKYSTFTAKNLPPDMDFLIIVYSANSKGKSDIETLTANTTKFTQKQKTSGQSGDDEDIFYVFNPIIATLVGIVVALVLIAIIIVVVMRFVASYSVKRHNNDDHVKTHIPFQTTVIDQDFQQYEMKDPDIIPARNSVNDSGYEDFADDQNRRKKNNDASFEVIPSCVKFISANNSNIGAARSNNKFAKEEVAYAELSLPPKNTSLEMIRRQEKPTEYASIDFKKKPLINSTNSPYVITNESDMSVETPLINSKLESTV